MNRKGDKKGNITAAFGSDITLGGMTAVPNLLLKFYSKLGITDREMMLIMQLIYMHTSAGVMFPTHKELADIMSGDESEIRGCLASLIEKEIISISHYYCEVSDEILPVYSLEPLFEKVSEFWACEKVSVYQKMKKNLKEQEDNSKNSKSHQKVFAYVCKAFEKEFARLLSPMEIEQINLWVNDFNGNPELILEALKRAVMLGKHNFKYIDIILLEWHKNNLNTISDVLAFEANFRERQSNRGIRRNKSQLPPVNKKDKFRLLYLG